MTTNNMYRVGDYVYFETTVTAPYQIRKIEELNKTPQGAVEAKAICFLRRRDISRNLIAQAEKHVSVEDSAYFDEDSSPDTATSVAHDDHREYFKDSGALTPVQHHQARHRELFVTRQVETLPATHIRGKCNVTLYNDAESIFDYLNKEDTFFYKFTYDYQQKSLYVDRNAIRVGGGYQAQVRSRAEMSALPERVDEGTLIYSPIALDPTSDDAQFQRFLMIVRSVGTLGRSFDIQSVAQTPELICTVSVASRDFSLQRARDIWFQSGCDMVKAISLLLPNGHPTIYKDELEKWTTRDYMLFQAGWEKHGKDFFHIQQDFLPWKSMKGVIEFYYMWKSTDKYWTSKRLKLSNTDHKLKQVYIPNFLKPNPAVMCQKPLDSNSPGCESCLSTNSGQWYNWGNVGARVCSNCWSYWKRFGGLRNPTSKDASLDNSDSTNQSNGDVGNTENPNQVGNFKCTQPDCDKEFRLKTQLHRHLLNNHNIATSSLMNGSWDILNQYSKNQQQQQQQQSHNSSPSTGHTNHSVNPTAANHMYSTTIIQPGSVKTAAGGQSGMVKPRSTTVFKVNLRFRVGRVLYSHQINPKKIARNHTAIKALEIEQLFHKIEKIPLQNLTSDGLRKLFRTSIDYKGLPAVIDDLHVRKGLPQSASSIPDFLTPILKSNGKSNGVSENNGVPDNNGACVLVPSSKNGLCDDSSLEPATKMRKIDSNCVMSNNNSVPGQDHSS